MRDLGRSYEIAVDGQEPDRTIAEFIERRLGGRTDIGDRVACGGVELIVRELDDEGHIRSVGVAVAPHHFVPAHVPLFMNARDLGAWLAKRFKRPGRPPR
jgi:potassium/hydrogen antiporter